MFIAALLTIAERWKQLTCPSVDEWIKKVWHIHKTKYYSALERKEILTYTLHGCICTCVFEDILLSELIQSQKDKYCMIPLL